MLILSVLFILFIQGIASFVVKENEPEEYYEIEAAIGTSRETTGYILPRLEKLSTYPKLNMLCHTKYPDTVTWLVQEYRKLKYDPVEMVKELASVVSVIVEASGKELDSIEHEIIRRCLIEISECDVNLLPIWNSPRHILGLFQDVIHWAIAKPFQDEYELVGRKLIESTCRHVSNGFPVKRHTIQVEFLLFHNTFKPEHLEIFLENGLPLSHKCQVKWETNWITFALLAGRPHLAYVLYKRGQRIPRNLEEPNCIETCKIDALVSIIAKEKADMKMEVVKDIFTGEEPSYLKCLPEDVVFGVLAIIILDLELASALLDVFESK